MTGRASKKDAWNSASRRQPGPPPPVPRAVTCTSTNPAAWSRPRSSRPTNGLVPARSAVRISWPRSSQGSVGGDQGAAPVGVGYTDHGARASDPAGLDERDQRLGEVLQHGAHEDGIDAAVRKRQLVDVAPHQRHRRGTGVEVDTDHHPVRPRRQRRIRRSLTPARNRDQPDGRRNGRVEQRTRRPSQPSGVRAPDDAARAGTTRTKPARSPRASSPILERPTRSAPRAGVR